MSPAEICSSWRGSLFSVVLRWLELEVEAGSFAGTWCKGPRSRLWCWRWEAGVPSRRPWWRGRRAVGGVRVVSFSWPAVVAGGIRRSAPASSSGFQAGVVHGVTGSSSSFMEVAAGTRAGVSAASGSTSTGILSPDGLSAACSAIPLDQRVVGQPLRHYSGSA
jgi:hypothetical protein